MTEATGERLKREVREAVAAEDKQRKAYAWRKGRTKTLRRQFKRGKIGIARVRRSIALQRKSRRTTMDLHEDTVRARDRLKLFRRRHTSPVTKALRWASRQEGITETPPGSNQGPQISAWQRFFGSWLVGLAWCGVFCGMALKAAGVNVTARIASVAMIEDDARAGINGFRAWHGPRAGRRGWLAVIGGRGVHVELIRRRFLLWYLTWGGNTSSGNVGSQSDGGGVFGRIRFFTSVHGCAEPAYPSK